MTTERRLIDANAYCKELYLERDYPGRTQAFMDAIEVAIADLSDMPTVDAVEVVHGRWEPVDHDGSWRVDKCSICHRRMHYVDYDQPYQYCPNCGAKMDLE